MFMNETMKPSCGEAYDATPVAVLAASETLTIALGMLTKSPVAAIVAGGLTGCVCSPRPPSHQRAHPRPQARCDPFLVG